MMIWLSCIVLIWYGFICDILYAMAFLVWNNVMSSESISYYAWGYRNRCFKSNNRDQKPKVSYVCRWDVWFRFSCRRKKRPFQSWHFETVFTFKMELWYIYIHVYIVNFHLSHWYCFASRFKQQHARTCGLKKCWNHMPQVENCNHLTSLCIVVSSIPNRTFVSSNQIGRWKLPSRWGFDSFMARRSELLGKSFFLFRWMAISSRISRFGRGAWY